ncbi:hypothetical protein [Spirillospora sp. NPDC029432]|uniref:hypothetical protein n=1 Tax=Spirillospora sp. NPDC029432 TaxID=3154599 RepID=UPI003456E98F
MARTAQGRWTLDHDGHRLEVEAAPSGATDVKRGIRLYLDGDMVAEATTSQKKVKLTHEDLTVKASWDWRGELSHCALAPAAPELEIKDAKDVRALIDRSGETWFTPPEGSRAARREALARRHPRLYAARHVVLAAAKVLLPLLGITALIRIPKPDIDLPTVDLPDIDPPDLPDIPWPSIDLPSIPLPDLALPGWIQAVLDSAKYWGPILIAIGIAVQEHERRKKQREKQREKAAERAAAAAASAASDETRGAVEELGEHRDEAKPEPDRENAEAGHNRRERGGEHEPEARLEDRPPAERT